MKKSYDLRRVGEYSFFFRIIKKERIFLIIIILFLSCNIFAQTKEQKQLQKDKPEKAIKTCEQYELSYQRTNCYKAVAEYYLENNNPSMALSYYRKVSNNNLSVVPKYFVKMNKIKEGIEFIKQNDMEEYAHIFFQGYFDKGEYENALKLAYKYNDVNKVVKIANHYTKNNDLEKAIDIGRSPEYAKLRNNSFNIVLNRVAKKYLGLNELEKALALQIESNYPPCESMDSLLTHDKLDIIKPYIEKYYDKVTKCPASAANYYYKLKEYEKSYALYKDWIDNESYPSSEVFNQIVDYGCLFDEQNKQELAIKFLNLCKNENSANFRLYKIYIEQGDIKNAVKLEELDGVNSKYSPTIDAIKRGNMELACKFLSNYNMESFKTCKWKSKSLSVNLVRFFTSMDSVSLSMFKSYNIDVGGLIANKDLRELLKEGNEDLFQFGKDYLTPSRLIEIIYQEYKYKRDVFVDYIKKDPRLMDDAIKYTLQKDYDLSVKLLKMSKSSSGYALHFNHAVKVLNNSYNIKAKREKIALIKEILPKVDIKDVKTDRLLEFSINNSDTVLLDLLINKGINPIVRKDLDSLYFKLIYREHLNGYFKRNFSAYRKVSNKNDNIYGAPRNIKELHKKITEYSGKVNKLAQNNTYNKRLIALLECYTDFLQIINIYIKKGLSPSDKLYKHNNVYTKFLLIETKDFVESKAIFIDENTFKVATGIIFAANIFDIAQKSGLEVKNKSYMATLLKNVYPVNEMVKIGYIRRFSSVDKAQFNSCLAEAKELIEKGVY